jgi:hypothetical protein
MQWFNILALPLCLCTAALVQIRDKERLMDVVIGLFTVEEGAMQLLNKDKTLKALDKASEEAV